MRDVTERFHQLDALEPRVLLSLSAPSPIDDPGQSGVSGIVVRQNHQNDVTVSESEFENEVNVETEVSPVVFDVDVIRQHAMGSGLISHESYTVLGLNRETSGVVGEWWQVDLFLHDAETDDVIHLGEVSYTNHDMVDMFWPDGVPMFTDDGATLIYATSAGKTIRYDLESQTIIDQNDGLLQSANHDGSVLLLKDVQAKRPKLFVVDTQTGERVEIDYRANVHTMASFSDNGRFVVLANAKYQDARATIFDRQTGGSATQVLWENLRPGSDYVYDVQVSNDGLYLGFRMTRETRETHYDGFGGLQDHAVQHREIYAMHRDSGELTLMATGVWWETPVFFPAGSNDADAEPVAIAAPVAIPEPVWTPFELGEWEVPYKEFIARRKLGDRNYELDWYVKPHGNSIAESAVTALIYVVRVTEIPLEQSQVVSLGEVVSDVPMEVGGSEVSVVSMWNRLSVLSPTGDDLLDREVALGLESGADDVW